MSADVGLALFGLLVVIVASVTCYHFLPDRYRQRCRRTQPYMGMARTPAEAQRQPPAPTALPIAKQPNVAAIAAAAAVGDEDDVDLLATIPEDDKS